MRHPVTFLRNEWHGLTRSRTVRSLLIGPFATLVDLAFSLSLFHFLYLPARWAAMIGVAAGSTFTFFANRYIAFRAKDPKLAKPALRFVLITIVSMIIHGQLVALAVERFHVPFVLAKIGADIIVFTIGQTLLLRFFVFRRDAAPSDKSLPSAREPGQTQAKVAAKRRQTTE